MVDGPSITAAQILWATAQLHPDRPCVTDLDREAAPTLTYAQVVDRAAAVAGGLVARGLQPGDRVALLLPNCLAYVDVYLGASAAGLVVVPLNVRLVLEDYLHMLVDSGSRLLVTTGEFLERFPEISSVPGLTVLRADAPDGEQSELDQLAAGATAWPAPLSRDGYDPASLMYTSGTTGTPKAVVLSHVSWRAVAEAAIEVLGMEDDEVTLHVAPLTHGAGFLLLPNLLLAGHNLLCRSFDAGRTLELMTERGVTGLFVVPSMIRMMLDAVPDGWRVPDSLRCLYYAGSPIDPDTMREAAQVFDGRMVQSFAQMESPMFFTALGMDDHRKLTVDGDLSLVGSAGRILPGVQLRIVDDQGSEVPNGTPGEVVAQAPQTMLGYWNRPDETSRTLVDGWLHTGDVGYLDDEGLLRLVDRKKDMIVTGGSNVYAREVEEVLVRLPGVKEAAVIGIPHRVWGEAVTAVLVGSDDVHDSESVVAACKATMAGYRVPKGVFWVDELPRNAYGKVLKRQLRDKFAPTSATGKPS